MSDRQGVQRGWTYFKQISCKETARPTSRPSLPLPPNTHLIAVYCLAVLVLLQLLIGEVLDSLPVTVGLCVGGGAGGQQQTRQQQQRWHTHMTQCAHQCV